MTLYEIIKALQDAPTKGGGKKAVLEAHKGNQELAAYLKAVYDPRLNYYITKLPAEGKVYVSERDLSEDDVQDLIENLSTRNISGKAAKEFLSAKAAALNVLGKELLAYIIGRDIKAGVGESTILEYFPGLFYIPPYQRCASMSVDLKEKFGAMPYFFVQSKSDGQFAYAIKPTHGSFGINENQLMTRTGSLYPEWLADALTQTMQAGYVAMGELLVYRDGVVLDRKTGNGILNSILSGDGSSFNHATDEVMYLAWDMVTEAEFNAGRSDRPYKERWVDIYSKTMLNCIPHWRVSSIIEANNLQRVHTAEGKEGTVWKNPDMPWRDCSSGDKNMMKAKTVFEAEYKIAGAFEGTGKYTGMLGGFDMETSDGFIKFSVGSGFNDEQRKALWSQGADACNGLIATCEGNDIVTSKGKCTESIFLPIFIEIRYDKKEADSRNKVWEQFEAAKMGKADE